MTDFALGTTFDIKFTTRRFSTGAPFTLAGTPAISAYPDNSLTQLTAGLTLTVDFDVVTGLNNIRVVATSANGYVAGSSYALVITTGTVDGVSVVGEVVGEFTLERGASFGRLGAPAGASVSADVAAVKAETASIQTDTNDIQTRLPAALVSGRIDANVGSISGAVGGVGALDRSTRTMVMGTVGAASSTTSVVTSSLAPAAAVADQFKGRIVIFDEDTTTVNLRGQATDITANTAGGVLTVTALTTAPVSGDTFVIV